MIGLSQIFTAKNIKRKAPCKCLSVIMLDFIIEANKKYYPQVLLKECKYEQKRTKMKTLLIMI